MNAIDKAFRNGRHVLSEFESKIILASYGIPVARERLVHSKNEAFSSAREIGYPVVLKGCSVEFVHKTEHHLVALNLKNESEAGESYDRIWKIIGKTDGGMLVQEMVSGSRELAIGLTRDAQLGPSVMFGLGGIFMEILKDVSFRTAPLSRKDSFEMMREIRGARILDAIRGMEAVNLDVLSRCLMALGQIGLDHPEIKEIDVNPMIVRKGEPIAVDALVILDGEIDPHQGISGYKKQSVSYFES